MKSVGLWATRIGLVICVGIGAVELGPRAQAGDDAINTERWRIQKGLEIAPMPLNLKGKDHDLVGLGSYLVNAVSTCSSCHGASAATEYADNHNPYFDEPPKLNPETYLGGGQNFGKVGPPPSPNIISRNLTPDKTGRPEGGRSFQEFLRIMRTGQDLDDLHPNCSATITTNCFLPPTDGSLSCKSCRGRIFKICLITTCWPYTPERHPLPVNGQSWRRIVQRLRPMIWTRLVEPLCRGGPSCEPSWGETDRSRS